MNIKKILCSVLALAMILSTMGTVVFADNGTGEITSLLGSGIETDPYLVTNLAELKFFRDSVNNGNAYDGKYIQLTADIDLANEEWTPIGTSSNCFKGMFDGNGKIISNLFINWSTDYVSGGSNQNYVGLFGYMNGGGNDSGIKNLTIKNVDISGCLYVGAILGRGYTSGIIENCHVTGDVNIEGYSYIGGIVGRYEYSTDANGVSMSNCSVKATSSEKGVINGVYESATYVGGILGFTTEPAPVMCFENLAVENVAVTGFSRVGGISGIAHQGNVYKACSVSKTSIYGTDSMVGLIVGACQGTESSPAKFENNTVDNETEAKSGETKIEELYGTSISGTTPSTNYAARIGDTHFETVQDAFKAATSGCTIKLLQDITTSELWDCRYNGAKFTVPVTIDGNGRTLKLTGSVDDKNWNTVLRFEDVATVKNLTIDVSEATGVQRGISSKLSVTVENCTIIGNGTSAKRAIIFGEGAGAALSDVTATITGSNFKNWSYGVSDNQSGLDAKKVSITGSNFDNANVLVSASEEVAFNDNTVEDGYVNISSYTAGETAKVTATGNTLEGIEDTISVNPENITADDAFATTVAKIGTEYYTSLQEALDYAVNGTGEMVVELLVDLDMTGIVWNPINKYYSYAQIILNGNNHTISGLTDMLFAGTYGATSAVTINDLTIADSNIVHDPEDTAGTIGVGAFIGFPQASDPITLKNCHLVNSTVKGGHWTGGLIGYAAGYAGNDGPVFMNLTIEDCSVTGSTITGKGSAGGLMGHATGNGWTNVVVTNTEVSGNTVTSTGSDTNKAGAVFGTVGAAGQPTTANGVTKTGGNSVAAIVKDNNVTSNGTAITTIYGRQGTATGVLELTGGEYEYKPLADTDAWASVAEGMVLTQNEYGMYTTVADDSAEGTVSTAVTEKVEVLLVPVDGDATKYDIVLKAEDGKAIHRFLSAELDIQLTEVDGTLSIQTVTGNDDLKIETIDPQYTDLYGTADETVWGFHLDEDAEEITKNEIKVGTVVLTGIGTGKLAVVANDKNKVEAIQSVEGNIVKKYVGADSTLVIDEDAVVNPVEVKPVTKTLTIQITFPNNISDNNILYQDMTVTVDGKDIETQTYKLGVDGAYILSDNKYVITIPELLVKDHAYNIQVKGAGYRTANYRVTMTEDKTVYFWNDAVKGEPIAYEEGGKVKVNANFLAGDIAEDNIIDKYDLAAVVSYFGKYDMDTTGVNAYAKYDLNRDGNIDSEDIAYVLASFGY